ncbi:MAG TPA: VanZ family protein, partial [Longimicrobium sp.]|nr:VanZ family protein [Longimicrobium sp.]
MNGFTARWGPALLWAAAVFVASSRPTLPQLPSVLGWDKLQHAAAYAVGGLLIARALGGRGRRAAVLAIVLGSLYGATDELHQRFVPNRSSSPVDWMADTLGVLAGVAL